MRSARWRVRSGACLPCLLRRRRVLNGSGAGRTSCTECHKRSHAGEFVRGWGCGRSRPRGSPAKQEIQWTTGPLEAGALFVGQRHVVIGSRKLGRAMRLPRSAPFREAFIKQRLNPCEALRHADFQPGYAVGERVDPVAGGVNSVVVLVQASAAVYQTRRRGRPRSPGLATGTQVGTARESRAIGYGGDALVSDATGLSRPTLRKGRRELESGGAEAGRIRRAGAGRPGIEQSQPGIKQALERLVDPLTRGDPQSPLRWTCKSRAKLAVALSSAGWKVSSTTVGRLLHELGYPVAIGAQEHRRGVAPGPQRTV